MSANCNGGIVSIPQALYGQNGISAYVYIAFADTVTPGNPDVVTGFSYEFPTPTSEWMAIFTTTTPINNPTAVDFDNYWVEIKGAAGVGSAGLDIEVNNSLVTGGPFTILNFLAAGASNLTGITGANAGAGQVDLTFVTAGLNKRYYTDILSEAAVGNLIPGASYWIVDIGDGENPAVGIADCSAAYYGQSYPSAGFDNYPHNAGIILRAISTTQFDSNGIYLARVLNRSQVPTLFVPGGTYNIGDYVENYNEAFELTGLSGVYTTDPAADPANWDFIPKDDITNYNLEVQGCIYDINDNIVIARWDKYNNYLSNVNSLSPSTNELIKKAFRWGTPSYSNNKIKFYDNVARSTTFRAPDYLNTTVNSNGNYTSLVNYSTIGEFSNNSIDLETSDYFDNSGVRQAGTRFYNVELQNCVFSNNKIENSVITNLSNSVFGNNAFVNNIIRDSVINKFHFANFLDNTITAYSVLGDIYYTVPAGGSSLDNDIGGQPGQTALKSVSYATSTITSGIWNRAILNNLGSKNYWFVGGDGTSTATNVGLNTRIQLNGPSSTHYSQVNDIVYFAVTAVPELLNTFKPIVQINSPTSFDVAGNIASPTTTAFTLNIIHPSIDTSFAQFLKNTLKTSIIRGVNKNCNSPAVLFKRNDLDCTIIENYVAHISVFDIYAASCDFGGSVEIGDSTSLSYGGFTFNKISNSIFYANSIKGVFANNEIYNTFFTQNGNTGSTPGLAGTFAYNIFKGTPIVTKNYYYPWLIGAATITVSGNNFNSTSVFGYNNIEAFNQITNCTLNATSQILFWTIAGKDILSTNAPYTGLISVSLDATVIIKNFTLEGRGARLNNVSFGVNNNREVNYGSSLTMSRLLFRDVALTTNYSAAAGTDRFVPALFADSYNAVRNITYTEGGATPVTIGSPGITYQTATYTLTVVTQKPHLLNTNSLGTVTTLGVEGLIVNTVGGATPPSFPSPNGNYRTFGLGNALVLNITVTTIVDAYTFTATSTQTTSGYYLLHSSNTVSDGNGAGPPGPGITGSYNTGGRDLINFNYWFRPAYSPKKNNYFEDNASYVASVVTPSYSELTTVIALGLSLPIPAIPLGGTGSRAYYYYYNYTGSSTLLYDSTTSTLTLPKYFEYLGGTVIFGSHNVTSTYQINVISNMQEGVPVRFVTTLGCAVQFNLVGTGALVSNRIIQDSAATSYTIRTYTFGSPAQYAYDEIVLMKQNGVIRILSKIIHV